MSSCLFSVCKANQRRQWTKAEENAVLKHFKSHIFKGHLASKKECLVFKQCEPALNNRTVQNIRDFVRNKGLTSKRQSPSKLIYTVQPELLKFSS